MKKLSEYKRKRNLSKSNEPLGKIIKSNKNLIYVIQKHNARNLHFDFRIELDGVLKSWAIPKGISEDPTQKRLAIMVEDHPLEYANFEGSIPKGQYGAGTVEIWDKGKYVNITTWKSKIKDLNTAIKHGHFTLFIKGKKLNGEYSFIRLSGNSWIVRKKEEKSKIKNSIKLNGINVEFTNTEKEIDKGITKSMLIEYYIKIAPIMLPLIKNRPVSMFRFPGGVKGEKFFQKDMPDYFPKWIKYKSIKHKSKSTSYVLIENYAGIAYLANQVVEMHVPVSQEDMMDTPDSLIFDFDPPEKPQNLEQLKKILLYTKNFLEKIGLKPYIMTTGGKGYHIRIPIKRELNNKEVREFALKISTILTKAFPSLLTTELLKQKRKGRIFIDVNRNSPMQTAIAPYSIRAKTNIPIASPFEWNELKNINPDYYTLRNPPKGNPWKDFQKNKVSLKSIIKNLKNIQT